MSVKWLAEIQKTWEPVFVRLTDREIKTADCAVLTVWRRQNGNHVNVPVRLIMIRDPETDAIRFAFSNIMDADTKVIAKMQQIVTGLNVILKMQKDCVIWIVLEGETGIHGITMSH